jgi:V8-like Glu-specific endopeptidase
MHTASGNPVLYYGTGWLIGRKHVITNHHVINARDEGEAPASVADFTLQARGTQIEFDYDNQNAAGEKLTVATLSIADALLDYAILELERAPGRDPLPIWARAIDFTEGSRLPVNIIQHPGGQPKQIAIRNNLTADLRGGDLAYFTDTEAGSSGSPVCNDRWQVLALHKASTRSMGRYQFQGKDTAWINVGTTIERIVGDVQTKDAELWTRIGALTL